MIILWMNCKNRWYGKANLGTARSVYREHYRGQKGGRLIESARRGE